MRRYSFIAVSLCVLGCSPVFGQSYGLVRIDPLNGIGISADGSTATPATHPRDVTTLEEGNLARVDHARSFGNMIFLNWPAPHMIDGEYRGGVQTNGFAPNPGSTVGVTDTTGQRYGGVAWTEVQQIGQIAINQFHVLIDAEPFQAKVIYFRRAGAPHQARYAIPLLKQKLRKIGTILACNTGNKGRFPICHSDELL